MDTVKEILDWVDEQFDWADKQVGRRRLSYFDNSQKSKKKEKISKGMETSGKAQGVYDDTDVPWWAP